MEGDLCQVVSVIYSKGGLSSVGLACHWAPFPRPGPALRHPRSPDRAGWGVQVSG